MDKTMKETLEKFQIPLVKKLTVIRIQHSDSRIEFGILDSYDYSKEEIRFEVEDPVPPARYVIKTVSWKEIIDFWIISPRHFVSFLDSVLFPLS